MKEVFATHVHALHVSLHSRVGNDGMVPTEYSIILVGECKLRNTRYELREYWFDGFLLDEGASYSFIVLVVVITSYTE